LDRRGLNALAYALAAHATDAAERLVRLGARTDTLLGGESMPVALVPVLTHDADGVRLMVRSGVDYRTLRYQGASAFDIARSAGDADVVKAMEGQKKEL
jgi:DNA-binding ferritin-like protein